jgi:hypothetical protein
MDDAYNIQRLINVYQMSEKDAADAYRASVAWIRDRLQLLELAPEAAQAVQDGRVKPSAAKAIAKLSREHQKAAVAKPGKVTAKDISAVAPKPDPKPSRPSLKDAIRVILAECDQQKDVMVYEIHRDNILALRASVQAA